MLQQKLTGKWPRHVHGHYHSWRTWASLAALESVLGQAEVLEPQQEYGFPAQHVLEIHHLTSLNAYSLFSANLHIYPCVQSS